MSTVPKPPPDANDDDPPSSPEEEAGPTKPPWKPSDPTRWAHLNLEDPDPSGEMPKKARVPDALAWALVAPGAEDPVEGIVDGVRLEIAAAAEVRRTGEPHLADMLTMWGRRLDAAMQLLRWIDNRERMPMENDFEEPPSAAEPTPGEPPPAEPQEDPEDVEVTRDAAPSSDAPKP
jgi:hypothetical protein